MTQKTPADSAPRAGPSGEPGAKSGPADGCCAENEKVRGLYGLRWPASSGPPAVEPCGYPAPGIVGVGRRRAPRLCLLCHFGDENLDAPVHGAAGRRAVVGNRMA